MFPMHKDSTEWTQREQKNIPFVKSGRSIVFVKFFRVFISIDKFVVCC